MAPSSSTSSQATLLHLLAILSNVKLSIFDVIVAVLDSKEPLCVAHVQRYFQADAIRQLFGKFCSHPATAVASRACCSDMYQEALRREVQKLVLPECGFRFNARHAKATQISEFSVQNYADTMSKSAPLLWTMVNLLLDADGLRRTSLDKLTSAAAVLPPATFSLLEDSADPFDEDEYDWGFVAHLSAEDLAGFGVLDDETKARETRQKLRVAERNKTVQASKAVAVISILMQSTNPYCNGFASVMGFNMQARATPEVIVETLAHVGLSVSPTTLRQMRQSLSSEVAIEVLKLADRMRLQLAFDNLDFNLPAAQATVEKPGHFVSVTSRLYLPLYHCDSTDLRYSAELWESSTLNPARPLHAPPPYRPSYRDIIRLLPESPTISEDYYISGYAFHILRTLLTAKDSFSYYRAKLGAHPDGTAGWLHIPVVRTEQFPGETMHIDAGKGDEQWSILQKMLEGAGYKSFGILEKYCVLVHGDLGTLEKVQTLRTSRRIESTAYTRLQWPVCLPGLFHVRMACVEAIWRTHIRPGIATGDVHSIFHLAGILRPNETGKLGSKPSFRLLHDVITYVASACILGCWQQALPAKYKTADDFARSRPSFDDLIQLSRQIARKFVAGDDFDQNRLRGGDRVFENTSLFLRDALLYMDLCHAMTHGHIQRVETNLAHWIPIFAACGKHKYATALTRFLTDLKHVYPEKMARAIRLNWLCNPTGKPDGFRAVDWLVELHNMMQKTLHGGEGSNRTIDLVKQQSVLIELYRNCLVQLEKNFHLAHRTVRHQPPDMTKTMSNLLKHIEKNALFVVTSDRGASVTIPNQFTAGMDRLMRQYQGLRHAADVDDLDELPDERDTELETEEDVALDL